MWNTAERVVFTRDPYFLSYQIFINRKLYVCFKSDASSDLIYPGFQSHFYSDSTSLLSIILVLSPRSLHSNLFGWLFLTFVHSFHFTFILLLYDLRRGRKERRKRHRFTPVSSLSVTLSMHSPSLLQRTIFCLIPAEDIPYLCMATISSFTMMNF